jgi:hypothetical protein
MSTLDGQVFLAIRLWTRIPDSISLAVKTGNEHWPRVLFAAWLVARNNRRFPFAGRHVSQPFTEAPAAELIGAPEELNRVVSTERRYECLHGAVVLVTQG